MESKHLQQAHPDATLEVGVKAGGVAALKGQAKKLAAASLSENTRRAYQGALQRFSDYLQGQSGTDDATLAAYLTLLHEAGKSPSVASMVVAAVRFHYRSMGQAPPIGPATERVLAGIRREGRDRGRGQAAGIGWSQADTLAAVATNGGQSLAGLRDAAIVAVMSDALLRVSELAALQVEDLETVEDGSGRLTIRHSKTDQEGQGALQYIGAPTGRRVRAWMDASGITRGPLFRRVLRGGKVVGPGALTVQSVRSIIKQRATDADLEGRFSGHSFRVGSAQSLAAAGASVVEMQNAGRWQSPSMPGRYARGQLAARGAVARLRYGS